MTQRSLGEPLRYRRRILRGWLVTRVSVIHGRRAPGEMTTIAVAISHREEAIGEQIHVSSYVLRIN